MHPQEVFTFRETPNNTNAMSSPGSDRWVQTDCSWWAECFEHKMLGTETPRPAWKESGAFCFKQQSSKAVAFVVDRKRLDKMGNTWALGKTSVCVNFPQPTPVRSVKCPWFDYSPPQVAQCSFIVQVHIWSSLEWRLTGTVGTVGTIRRSAPRGRGRILAPEMRTRWRSDRGLDIARRRSLRIV